jgi:hypothetical protein
MILTAQRIVIRIRQVVTSLVTGVILIPAAFLMFCLAWDLVQKTTLNDVEFLRALLAVIFAGGGLLMLGICVKMIVDILQNAKAGVNLEQRDGALERTSISSS